MNKILLIHSYDNTTAFLQEIAQYLEHNGCTSIVYVRIDQQTMGNKEEVAQLISQQGCSSTVVFLGHGASHCIYGPMSENGKPTPFIDESTFHFLSGKNFVCLSCRSVEFIMKNFDQAPGSAMIGFDDLPTHWNDVYSEREVNDKAYYGITEEILSLYRDILVESFSISLYDAITQYLSFNQFYLRLRLYINRKIFWVTNFGISNKPTLLANMLFELKKGTRLFGDETALILHPGKDTYLC